MGTLLQLSVFVSILGLVAPECEVAVPRSCNQFRAAATNNRFTFHLFNEILRSSNGSNIFISPANVGMSLSMLLPGANGKTKKELIYALKWGHTISHFETTNLPCLYAFYNSVISQQVQDNLILKTASAIFGEESVAFNETTLENLKQYGAPFQKVPFSQNVTEATETINQWVNLQTDGKVDELLSEGDVKSSTVMLLTSAIYFKAEWKDEFQINDQNEPFSVTSDHEVDVKYMNNVGYYKYYWNFDIDAVLLEVPYKANTNGACLEGSMVLVMKHRIGETGVNYVDGKMKTALKILKKKEPRKVELRIPVFKLSKEYRLKRRLWNMGVQTIFSPFADFSKFIQAEELANTVPIVVSDVIHKTYIEVNERGTVASAATGIPIQTLSLPSHETIRFNQPFHLFIFDKTHDNILFAGRVADPSKTN